MSENSSPNNQGFQLPLFDGQNDEELNGLPLPEIIARGGPDWAGFPLAYHNIDGKRYYSVQDWIKGVTLMENTRDSWCHTVNRYPEIAAQCKQAPYRAKDGKKYVMDFASTETIIAITLRMRINTGACRWIYDYLAKVLAKMDEYRLNQATEVANALLPALERQVKPEQDIEAKHKARRVGYVYLLRSVSGFYKIGRTKNPENRLYTFRLELPFEVDYEHLIECENMFEMEHQLHREFASRRINGEWFDLTESDIAAIKTL